MFLLRYLASPRPDNQEAATVGGAFVNCWIDLPSLDAAKAAAEAMIEEYGWTVRRLEEQSQAFREDLAGESLEYYEQAEIDKTVLVFHTWPIHASDAGNEE